MPKFLKRLLIIIVALVAVGFAASILIRTQTKKHSPEETAVFNAGDLTVTVNYSRPYKKGREIFGGLVPYGKVWRTGANEATTVEFNKEVSFGGTRVPAGTYTLWTIPGPTEWSVILNSKMYGWGVNFDTEASREPIADVATAKVVPEALPASVEQFTITVEGTPPALVLQWDLTRVAVPLQ
jgi:hypothetical protein